MHGLLLLLAVAVTDAPASLARMPTLSGGAEYLVGARTHPATVASPAPYFALFGGGFLLLSFVLILIGPRNDHRR